MLELAGGEVARGAGAVDGHQIDVRRAIADPPLVVEAAEEPLDLARCLRLFVFGVVALVAGAAGERDLRPVGAETHIAYSVGHRGDGAHLATGADRHDVQRGLVVGVAALGGERERGAVGTPRRLPVMLAVGHRARCGLAGCVWSAWSAWSAWSVGEPHLRRGGVGGNVDPRHDERDLRSVRGHRRRAGLDDRPDEPLGKLTMIHWATPYPAIKSA